MNDDKIIFAVCKYTYGYDATYVVESVHLTKPNINDKHKFCLELNDGDNLDEVYNEQTK